MEKQNAMPDVQNVFRKRVSFSICVFMVLGDTAYAYFGIAFSNFSNHTLKSLSRTAFGKLGRTGCNHVLYFLGPAY